MKKEHDSVQYLGSDKSLSIGFLLCFALTITAYCITQTGSLSVDAKIGIIAGLAFAQFLAQMFFFLHLGRERKPRWKIWMFFSMAVVVAILIVGSMWIMHNLDYGMLRYNQTQQKTYLKNHEGL